MEDIGDFDARHRKLFNSIPRPLLSTTVEEFAIKYDGSVARFKEDTAHMHHVTVTDGITGGIQASARKR